MVSSGLDVDGGGIDIFDGVDASFEAWESLDCHPPTIIMSDPITVEDEHKSFESVDAPHEEETQPDPDEELMLDQGNGRVWLVKVIVLVPFHNRTTFSEALHQVPKYLMERWSAIDVEDVHLASIRVYPSAAGPSGKKPRIVLFLPPNITPDQAADPQANQDPSRPVFVRNPAYTAHRPIEEPDAYELEMVNDAVDNQIVVAERPKDPLLSVSGATPSGGAVNPRARTTILTGRIKHDCNLRPVLSESYRRQMKERSRKYNLPKRQIQMIEDAGVPGGRGGVNRLSSGVGMGANSTFGNLIVRATLFLFHRFLTKVTPRSFHSRRNRSPQKALSNGWRGYHGISFLISSSIFSATNHDGGSSHYERRRSNLKHILRKCSAKLLSSIGMVNIMGCGS